MSKNSPTIPASKINSEKKSSVDSTPKTESKKFLKSSKKNQRGLMQNGTKAGSEREIDKKLFAKSSNWSKLKTRFVKNFQIFYF